MQAQPEAIAREDAAATITPIFLFCLPRSGSTLIQRVLAAHEEIATTSEPWLLLPFLYTLEPPPPGATFPFHENGRALRDFFAQLPGGRDEYEAELRRFAERLYRRAAGSDATYFLDKTPIYHLIAEQIIELFPDAKLIFLWRNPLSVAVSNTETFGAGRWKPQHFATDLYNGLDNLLGAFERHRDRAVAVRYEDLVLGDEAEWRRLLAHVDLDFDAEALERFADVRLAGSFKDPTGVERYRAISTEPLTKWRDAIRNPIRKAWCESYLRWVGRDRMARMGYDYDETLEAIRSIETGLDNVRQDAVDVGRSFIQRRLRRYVFDATLSASAWRFLYGPRQR